MPDMCSQPTANEDTLPNTHNGPSFSSSLGSASVGQKEISTQELVLQLIEDLHELANIEDTDTLRMFKPALEQSHENITALLTIA